MRTRTGKKEKYKSTVRELGHKTRETRVHLKTGLGRDVSGM